MIAFLCYSKGQQIPEYMMPNHQKDKMVIYIQYTYILPIVYFCFSSVFRHISKKRLSNKVETRAIGSSLLSSRYVKSL